MRGLIQLTEAHVGLHASSLVPPQAASRARNRGPALRQSCAQALGTPAKRRTRPRYARMQLSAAVRGACARATPSAELTAASANAQQISTSDALPPPQALSTHCRVATSAHLARLQLRAAESGGRARPPALFVPGDAAADQWLATSPHPTTARRQDCTRALSTATRHSSNRRAAAERDSNVGDARDGMARRQSEATAQ
ncbi:MAG: hypothetical protein RL385_2685 [Pseudomonadota bacterium]